MAYIVAIYVYILINIVCYTKCGAQDPQDRISREDMDAYLQDPASQELIAFKNSTAGPTGILTATTGELIEIQETDSLNANLLRNKIFVEAIQHVNRERLPPRVVHAKGAGAFGYFEVTHDITQYCNAKLFETIGKRTRIAGRFSSANTDIGGIDLPREPRGFSVKFYTEEGNFDIAGFNMPVFFFKDPQLFSSLLHSLRKNPVSNVPDLNSMFDFFTLRPECTSILFYILSDIGIPKGYRHMTGFSIHAYEILNENGTSHFAKFNFYPDQGIININSTEAVRINAVDADYGIRDLYNAIANASYPSWTMKIEVMSLEDVENADFDPFDLTIEWPKGKYPEIPVGRLVFNENPKNYFADVEQLAFDPGHLVPGITGAPDKIFEGRLMAYRDAQNYRLGANHNKIPVNCPLHARTYYRDGVPPVLDNSGGEPNFFPNSYNGPVPFVNNVMHKPRYIAKHKSEADLTQSSQFYENLSNDEKDRLAANMASFLNRTAPSVQRRALDFYKTVSADLVSRVNMIL